MGTRTLGKYRLLRHLATGGMAEIWLADAEAPPNAHGRREAAAERIIAVIKVILPERAHDKTFVQMFLDEARVAASLHHPHIAQLYEVGRDGDTYFHALEYVHGHNARAMVERSLICKTAVPLAMTLGVGIAVASALHYAHERKGTTGEPLELVHRDVTPSNIMIGWDGVVKLVDFGVALASRRAAETRTGVVKGKLAYMSPEQCRGKKVDRRADVFSLGVTLYELSTQRRAFRSDSEYQTMERIVRGDLAPPSSLVPGYPPALEQIVLKAVATDLAARYQTAAELGAALEAFRREAGVEETRPAIAGCMRTLFGEPRTPQEDAAEAAEAAAVAARMETAPEEEGTAEVMPTAETSARMEVSAPPAVIMTGPMPVVAAPGPTSAMAVASRTVEQLPPQVRGGLVKIAAVLVLFAVAGLAVKLSGGTEQRVDPTATGTLTRERAPAVAPVVQPVPAAAVPAEAPPAEDLRIVPARSDHVRLSITSRPPGAEISVDEVVRGETPLDLRLPRSETRIKIELRASGHVTYRKHVTPDRDQALDTTLERRVVAATADAKDLKPPDPVVEQPKDPQVDAGEVAGDLSTGRY